MNQSLGYLGPSESAKFGQPVCDDGASVGIHGKAPDGAIEPKANAEWLMQVKPCAAGGRMLAPVKGAIMSKDPVCGMTVGASQASGQSEFEGENYYFCCAECQRKFEADPAQFAAAKPQRIPCCGFGCGVVRHTSQRGFA